LHAGDEYDSDLLLSAGKRIREYQDWRPPENGYFFELPPLTAPPLAVTVPIVDVGASYSDRSLARLSP
jgi:hypothetical protein